MRHETESTCMQVHAQDSLIESIDEPMKGRIEVG